MAVCQWRGCSAKTTWKHLVSLESLASVSHESRTVLRVLLINNTNLKYTTTAPTKEKIFLQKKHTHTHMHSSLCPPGPKQDVPTFDFETPTAGFAASGVSVVPRDPRRHSIKFLTPLLPLGFQQFTVEIWLPVEQQIPRHRQSSHRSPGERSFIPLMVEKRDFDSEAKVPSLRQNWER